MSNRDDVVSDFVRTKIRNWRDSGRELKELARLAGFAKSTPSQVLLGTGVGAKTGPKFAKAFGFESYDALKQAAWEWWSAESDAPSVAQSQSEAVKEAVSMVLDLRQGTEAQVRTVLQAYAHPRFQARDYDWWLRTLMAELAADRDALRGHQTKLLPEDKQLQIQTKRELQEVQQQRTKGPKAPPSRKREAG